MANFALTLVHGQGWDESRAGLLAVGSIQPWALWLDFRNDTRTA